MFRLHATIRFGNKLFHPISTIFNFSFANSHCSQRYLHTIDQFKHKKTVRLIGGKWKSSAKPRQTEQTNPIYMRDVITKISNILRFSSWESAREHLESLALKWDSFTINQVLKTHPPLERAWLFFNWASGLRGFKHDKFTYTTMLDIFGEARRISSMKYIFKQMQDKGIKVDVVTYTSIIHWLSNDGDIDGAVSAWEEMKSRGLCPTVVSYTAFMKVLFNHNRVKEAVKIYKEMCESGLSPSCYTYTVLMVHLIDSGKCRPALEIFIKMQEAEVQPDKAACNILIEKLSKSGEAWAILEILQYMKDNHLVLRYPVYLLAHEALKTAGESDLLLRQVNPHIFIEENTENSGIAEEYATGVSAFDMGLIMIFLKKKNFHAIDQMLSQTDENAKLDSEMISTVIKSSCSQGKLITAKSALDYSLKTGIIIEESAYRALIGILIRTHDFPSAVEIVDEMAKAGIFLETDFACLLIHRLGSSKQLNLSMKVFDSLPCEQKDTATYTALIAACLSCKDDEKAIEIFRIMKSEGVYVAIGTYNALISGLEKCGRHADARAFLREKKRFQHGSCSSTSGSVEELFCDLLFAGSLVA